MNIALLSTFSPFRGGIAQFNASLYRALEVRHQVMAFTFTRQYPDMLFPGRTQYLTEDDRADRIPAERLLDTVNPLSWLRTASVINSRNPDLLLMKFWMSFFAPSLGTVAGRMNPGTRVITILDNVLPHERRFFDLPLTRYFLRRNHGFVVMSSAVEDELRMVVPGGVPTLRIAHPLYDHFGSRVGMDTARQRLGLPPDARVVLFFGFIRDYKGLDLLIRAADRLDGRYHLVIAGETYGSFTKYDTLIRSSSLRENIHVHNNYIEDSKIPDFFCAADVCVLPYRTATQSGITSIAYHFDLPVIVTDVGGLGEDVGGRGTGLVVGPPDPELIASGIRRYFDEGMRDRCIVNISAVKREENWERYAAKLTAFAETLLPS